MAIKNSGAEFVLIDAKSDGYKHLGFKKPIFKNNIMENMIGRMSLRREYG
ncbi:hypothetical protein Q7M76_04220 [Candidatus Liberibacter asiaticus]|uniref:Uncharacterized protein n=2 Tax=Liberibacter asiaticus TaxID=34021 RepID=C6XGD2_LIBAP|nr:hypothetical protein [Candidatus Liberibacter asiaticus]ACT57435.1 hypothetical protein CLIBASIA_04315 [Candidatus Liberibacter asiaticus str. psy62]AGH17199.1 hypothetical protein WSI_04145 [Candidatus Liberibacter asiaticus str. gxpsy]KAE9509851.1 hypothetical protein FXW22_04165 [Candidatus Liberibacter asiaticus]KAE9511345.1 hypothetical protein FXW31_01945 [Candidatus Liberibacter asiaticus]KAE9512017.1 hypothetical protein FXW32_04145 [Candidatus Liberibacter asiaticus]